MSNVTSIFPFIPQGRLFRQTLAFAQSHPNICIAATAIASIAGAATYYSLASNSVDPIARIAQIQQSLDESKALVLIDFYNALPFEKPPLRGNSLIEQAAWAKFWLEGEGRRGGNPVVRNCTRLDFSSKLLNDLPPEIGEFKSLQYLHLFNNRLVTLPAEIGQLTALTELNLSENELQALPPQIGQLTALTELFLSNNQLRALPPAVGQLTALTNFVLTTNRLTALPPEIGQLTALTSLDLSGNQLTALPSQIGQLTALTNLSLSDNQLTALPPAIGQLTVLTSFALTTNRLTALPPEIGQLTALRNFALINNQLTALPPEIGQLTALTALHLTNNRLTALPPEIGQLTTLMFLLLSNNQLTALPDSIWNLPLNVLILANNNNFNQNVVADFQQRLTNYRANHPNEGPTLFTNVPDVQNVLRRAFANVPDVQNVLHRAPEVSLATKLQAWATEFELAFPGQGHRTEDFSPLTSLNPDETAKLGAFLNKIREISDYAQPISDSAKDVIARVEKMIQLACLHPDFRAKMLLLISGADTDCRDRTLLFFNELEVEAYFYEVEQRDNTFICQTIQDNSFVAKAIHTASYYVLKEYARKYVAQNAKQFTDIVETVVGFHTSLRPLLAETINPLPISTQSMRHPGLSGLTPGAIEEGKKFMLNNAAPTFLLEHSPQWQQRMRDRYPERANVVDEKFTEIQEAATEYYFGGLSGDEKEALLEANPTLQIIVEQHATHKDPKQAYDLATLDIQELMGVSLAHLGGDFAHIMRTPGPSYDRLISIFNPDEMGSLSAK